MSSSLASGSAGGMGRDALLQLLTRASGTATDEWDDDLVARTLDEVVADLLPSSTGEEDGMDEMEQTPLPDQTDATAADKRLRHRQAMQRCRERKRSRMNALEKQQRRLKTLLHNMLVTLRKRDEPTGVGRSGGQRTIEEVHTMFVDAVRFKEELLGEREALKQSLLMHQKYEKIVTSAINQITHDPAASPLQTPKKTVRFEDVISPDSKEADPTRRRRRERPPGHWVQYLEDEDPLFYEPETEDAIAEHTRECFLRVRRLQDGFLKRPNGVAVQDTYCLGWHAQHSLTRTPDSRLELRFRFHRRVPRSRMSLTEIQRATWNVMKDPVQNARLYSALVVCKIVQWIGKDAFIFIRNSPDKDKRLHVRYFSLHSQMEYQTDQDERAVVTLMKVLDKDPHFVDPPTKPSTVPVIWLKEGTLFLGFTEKLATDEIEIEYGGSIHCMNDQHAAYLLIEVGGALMRWEHMVIPQRLLL